MSQMSRVVTTWGPTESSREGAPASPTDLAAEVAEYLPLVRRIALHLHRKCPANVQLDDLIASGAVGLLDALRRSGPDRGKPFQFYASTRIRGAILDELRALDWLSRSERLAARAQGDDCATIVGFDDLPDGLDAEAYDDAASPLESAELRSDRDELAEAVARLPEREASIVAMHYYRGRAFKDIASELHVSEPRISQLHARAVKMLRQLMSETERSCLAQPGAP
jgi:RNA polymerase sigma factor for flagellar operon FliA